MTSPAVVGFDALELWVGDAARTRSFFTDVLGFAVDGDTEHAAGGPVTSCVHQGNARVVLTQATEAGSAVADYVRRHGDGVKDIGFSVRGVDEAFEAAVRRGAAPVSEPHTEAGRRRATVAAFGDTTHTLFEHVDTARHVEDGVAGVRALDHLAVSVEADTREQWARYYERVFGFERVGHDERVETDGSAFTMATVRGPDGGPTLVLAEPASGSRRSQIADHIDRFGGPGVHHIALATDDIFASVTALSARGLRLLDVPPGYYEQGRSRLHDVDVPWESLEQLGVLVDADGDGHLFQVFTEPLVACPTVHLELIQRVGSKGFGNDNVRELYHAVVREQEARDASRGPNRSAGGAARATTE